METEAKPGQARLRRALAENPKLEERFFDLWCEMPDEYKLIAIKVHGRKIFEALPREIQYSIFECGWSWVETQLDHFEAEEALEDQRDQLRKAKRLMADTRKILKEIRASE